VVEAAHRGDLFGDARHGKLLLSEEQKTGNGFQERKREREREIRIFLGMQD
jgi:hypothetical protein